MKGIYMKRKILLILLAISLAFSMFACGGGSDPCDECVDKDGDGFCDKCDEVVESDEHACRDRKPKDDKCDICGANLACEECIDEDEDAKCDECGKAVECEVHKNANEDRKCDVCKKTIPVCDECDDKNKNGKCDLCGSQVACKTCIDEDPKDARCDVCGEDVPCVTHVNANEDSKCDVCQKNITPCQTHVDSNENGKCDVCGTTAIAPPHTCIDEDPKDASCDVCGSAVACTTHVNANEDRRCDICKETLPVCQSCADTNKNAKCDVCGSEVPCASCVDEDPRDAICDVCGKDVPCTECEDDDEDGRCDVCGNKMPCVECADTDGDDICDECGNKMPVIAEIILIDEEAKFQFVIASSASAGVKKTVEQTIIKGIERKSGLIVTSVIEGGVADKETEYEVLVGDVLNRGDEYLYDRYSLGKKGYVIKIIGNKIIINAGSDAALEDALMEFADKILDYENKHLNYITMTEKQNVEKIQTGYKVTSLSVNGTDMKGYKIAADLTIAYYKSAAEALQDTIYDRTGYWLPIVPIENAPEKAILLNHIAKVYSEESFKVYADGEALRIDCAFDNKLADATTTFVLNKISTASGDVNFVDTVYTQDISFVTYEEFEAKGDGKTDDFVALYNAHVFANECGQTVIATKGKTYLIVENAIKATPTSDPTAIEIPIRTNTIWTGAEFIIDDRFIDDATTYGHSLANTHVFKVKSNYYKLTWYNDAEKDPEHYEIINNLGSIGEAYGTERIDLGLDYPALLIVYNDDHAIYRRYGADYANRNNGKGSYSSQNEIIEIDENGYIDESTPFMFDYTKVTKIEIIRTDVEPITVTGGKITTRACTLDASYVRSNGTTKTFGYYNRGLAVNRSHTVIDGVQHYITDEVTYAQQVQGHEGAHYQGFFTATEADEITFLNCVLQGRRYYGLSGTYDFSGSKVNKIVLDGCIQRNFWVDEDGKPSDTDTGKVSMERVESFVLDGVTKNPCYTWGIGGTNFCKNMIYRNSRLSRFDAHQGLYNGVVENCELQAFEIIGKGDFIVKNVTWYTYAAQNSSTNSVIALRSDYGSTWDGDIYVDGFYLYTTSYTLNLVGHSYKNWDFGYTCYIPSIEIKDLYIYYKATRELVEPEKLTINLYSTSMVSEPYMHLDETKATPPKTIQWSDADGEYVFANDNTRPRANDNKTTPPAYVKIVNNPNNYTYVAPFSEDENFFFSKTKFIYGDGANDYYLGTKHDGNTGPYYFKQ